MDTEPFSSKILRRLGLILLVLGAAAPAPLGGLAYGKPAQPVVPHLAWADCQDPARKGFQCATAAVPLDYREPTGELIELAVVRHRAELPERRIGTLFFNPGGPGGAGTQDLPLFLDLFPQVLRNRFDLVSWDPRGILNSSPVLCFASAEEEAAFFGRLPAGFPVGDQEVKAWIDGNRQFGQRCKARAGKLLSHVSTTENARDLDLLRQALGSRHMNYLGISYGTLLGAIYANLYPDRVRAMVLDGNLDPVPWFAEPGHPPLSTSLRLESDLSTAATLRDVLRLCGKAGPRRCAFADTSAAATEKKFETLLARLRAQPVTLDGIEITYAVALSAASGYMTTVEAGYGFRGWVAGAEILEKIWQLTSQPSAFAAPTTTPVVQADPPDQVYESAGQVLGVLCGETNNPKDPAAYVRTARLTVTRAGPVGLNWSWQDEPCSTWPAVAADNYKGPWNRWTKNPILLIGNTGDPQTGFAMSQALERRLLRARLLTVEGYGHTALLNPSTCANDYQVRYFLYGVLPRRETVCQQDAIPFAHGGSTAG